MHLLQKRYQQGEIREVRAQIQNFAYFIFARVIYIAFQFSRQKLTRDRFLHLLIIIEVAFVAIDVDIIYS